MGENANGVLYKLGGAGGGLTGFAEDGVLCYEYNLFIIQRTKIRPAPRCPRRLHPRSRPPTPNPARAARST